MSDPVTLTVWEHAKTDKAILVHSGFISAEADRTGAWLPLSQIKIIEREHVKNPHFREKPHIVEYLGWRLTIELPGWLAEKNRLRGARI